MSNTILHIPAMPEAETVSPDFTAKANGLNLPIRYIPANTADQQDQHRPEYTCPTFDRTTEAR